jgi:flagellin
MALVINSNIAALRASDAASSVNKAMATAMERLSTGSRINSAADDAAGVAIASRLESQIRGTDQAIRNAGDAQSFIDSAEGAHLEIVNILQRMREIAVQAASDTNSTADRTSLQAEMTALTTEINRIAEVTQWAGQNLLDASGGTSSNGIFNFQIGANTDTYNELSVTIGSMTAATIGVGGVTTLSAADLGASTASATNVGATVGGLTTVTTGQADVSSAVVAWSTTAASVTIFLGTGSVAVTGLETGSGSLAGNAAATAIANAINAANLGYTGAATTDGSGQVTLYKGSVLISSQSQAQTAITSIDTAIAAVNTQRGALGAISNRLDSTIANLTNISTNLQAGVSRVQDADFAAESTALSKNQILQQASTAMLAQANASKQTVLSLLQG